MNDATKMKAKQVIFSAITQNQVEPVVKLVQAGYPVNEPVTMTGTTLTMLAASSQCSGEDFAQIMSLSPDLNQKDRVGRTALHFACRAGRLEIFNQLFEDESVEIDAITNCGVTPLMMAIESGNIQLVAQALNSNLNPFLKDALGKRAIDYAQSFRDVMGHDMRELIQKAMDQWMAQTTKDEQLNGQITFDAHFNEFHLQQHQ